jgi:hypothetical protein
MRLPQTEYYNHTLSDEELANHHLNWYPDVRCFHLKHQEKGGCVFGIFGFGNASLRIFSIDNASLAIFGFEISSLVDLS